MKKRVVLVFTDTYPYGGAHEQTFLDPEVEVLARNFEQVILLPQRVVGRLLEAAPGVRVDTSLSTDYNNFLNKVRFTLSFFVLKQFWDDLTRRGLRVLHPRAFYRLLAFAGWAHIATHWLPRFLAQNGLEASSTVCYTFWLGPMGLAVGTLKNKLPGIKMVSRAHSADLYEERFQPVYLPCRHNLLASHDLLLPDSIEGERYITRQYPWFADRCRAMRQGINDPGFLVSNSSDNTFRLMSCSYLIARKRVDLIIRGLAGAATQRPELHFEWNHIGDGELREALTTLAKESLPTNVSFKIHGYLLPDQMMSFYANRPIDLFINMSSNEGTPVSLMEAAGCGMPIVATRVGGNSEVVSNENGLLIDSNPTIEEITLAILWFVDNPEQAQAKRAASRRIWAEYYDAAMNFQKFSDMLKSL